MPVPLRDIIAYAVGAVITLFAANEALHSSGSVSLYTLSGLNPIRDYLPAYQSTNPLDSTVPLEFTTPENEPSTHGTIQLESTIPLASTVPLEFTITENEPSTHGTIQLEPTIPLASTVPVEFTTPDNEPSKHGTIQLEPTIPLASTIPLEPTTPEDKPFKHGTFTPVDEADPPEDKKHTKARCSTLCRFIRTHQKHLVIFAIISRKWSSFVMQNIDKVIDFGTQEPVPAGLIIGFFMTLIIIGSSSSRTRVPVDRSGKDYGASDVHADVQGQARKTEKQIAVAEITKLWNANTRLTAEKVTFQRQLHVKSQEASEQKSTIESIRAALSIKTEEHCSAKTSLDELHENNKMLSSEKRHLKELLAAEGTASKKACDLRDDRITELGAALESKKKKYADERQQFQKRIANLERLNEDQVSSSKLLAESVSTLGETLALIKKENGSLQISLSDNQGLLDEVWTDSQKAQAATREENSCLEGLHREATGQVAALRLELVAKGDELQKLAEGKAAEKSRLEGLHGEATAQVAELRLELAAKGDELQKLAEGKAAEKSRLEGLHGEATAQVAELRLELAAKGDEIKKLVEEKEAALAIYKQKTADLRRNLKNAKKEATGAPEATSADPPVPGQKAGHPDDDDDEGGGDDNGKATASGETKRRRKRKHAGRNPTSAPALADDGDDPSPPSAPSAGQAGIVAQ